MQVIIMTFNRVIWGEFGIKKPPKNEDAQRGSGNINIDTRLRYISMCRAEIGSLLAGSQLCPHEGMFCIRCNN